MGWVNEHDATWSKQDEILTSVVDNRYTAVQSCHGPGKSWTMARLTGWWLDTHPVGEAFVVTTAPTAPQVEAILWREISGMHTQRGMEGRTTLDAKWYIGSQLVAYGRKPADYRQDAFQGIHARFVLVIIDEACGVPVNLYDAVDSLVTNTNSRVVAVGNPDDPSSHFAKMCRPGSGWKVIRISVFDTPNFTGEAIPEHLVDLLPSKVWVEERKKRWGERSPTYISKVLGKFPSISDDTLIHPGWVLRAQERWTDPDSRNLLVSDELWEGAFGVDIARYGSDETVVYLREAGRVWLVHNARGDSTMVTAGHVLRLGRGHRARPVAFVDDVGVGGGVTDRVAEQGYSVVGLNGGDAPVDKTRFYNARSEWYWDLREAFEKDEIDIDPEDEDLAAHLQNIKWTVDSKGRIAVETKDEMKKRGLPSPDRADGVCYAWRRGIRLPKSVTDRTRKKKSGITEDLASAGF